MLLDSPLTQNTQKKKAYLQWSTLQTTLTSNGSYLTSTHSMMMFPVKEEAARAASTYFNLSFKCWPELEAM